MSQITAFDVAKFFIHRGNQEEDSVSHMKLQKLIYYTQGYHLALYDTPLFHEKIEAWKHGPVCPSVYGEYKGFGANPINKEVNEDFTEVFSPDQLELLNEVYDVFGQFAAWKLRNMTHEEAPWINHAENAEEIPQDELKEFFATRLN